MEEAEVDKMEFIEYTKQLSKLESIHKITHINQIPYLVSLRVIRPCRNSITNDTYNLTTSNQTFSNQHQNDHNTGAKFAFPQVTGIHLPNQSTVSLLAALQHSLAGGAHSASIVGQQTMPTMTLDYLQNLDKITDKHKENGLKLLLTCTNINDEYYEAELGFDELQEHRKKISMSHISWANYLNYLHYGLFIYRCSNKSTNVVGLGKAVSDNDDDEMSETSISLQFDEENRDSKDVIQLVIYSPLKVLNQASSDSNEDDQNATTTDKNSLSIRLKFLFELYAVRHISDFTNKLQQLVFDLALYNSTLYETRVLQDSKTISELRRELNETRQKLRQSQDRLILYQPNANVTPSSTLDGEYNSGSSSDQEKKSKNNAPKRNAPKSLINPNQKRRTQAKGAKIQ